VLSAQSGGSPGWNYSGFMNGTPPQGTTPSSSYGFGTMYNFMLDFMGDFWR